MTTPSPSTPTVWVLDDGRPGNTTQCIGIAQGLGYPFEIRPVRFSLRGRLPNLVQGAGFKGLSPDSQAGLQAPWPTLVLGAGRRIAPVLRGIKRASGGQTRIIQLLDPECAYREFDAIILPEHDHPKPRPNQLTTLLTPHRLTEQQLTDAARTEWLEHWQSLPRPHIALILGGSTKAGEFSGKAAALIAGQLNDAIAQLGGGSILLSTSRRTPYRAMQILREQLKAPTYFYDWHEHQGQNNPMLAMLAECDYIVMTGDSMAMLSEAAFTGKPLYIADRGPHIAAKHRRFIERLYAEGFARALEGELRPFSYQTPNAARQLADALRKRLNLP